ncbi:GTP cyclohydrolase I FolE [Dermabacter sp. HSID17554]|uniref:GTP cyclohydrolase I FolE n=1 Tax=Dermabacter sp. HSID17554 TaxID=2419511 RepID=UPI000F874AE0|nr:GTP cyclohydrolase I FolE [Dermabacter sp. HSID17554]RUP86327.1 GTP cyclohydrolase I FolE [Dermabacter sp. HSID17554]
MSENHNAVESIDRERIERAVREILEAIGEDPDRDGLLDTPARVARMYGEVFRGLHENPREHMHTKFEVEHRELVLVRDIRFYSMCEHHLVPFFGRAHVGYVPGKDGTVAGLSKFARLVEGYAARPQVQERLTSQIADAIHEELHAHGTIVVLQAEHLCMAMRGVKSPNAETVTSAVRGSLQSNAATRSEAMSLILTGLHH